MTSERCIEIIKDRLIGFKTFIKSNNINYGLTSYYLNHSHRE